MSDVFQIYAVIALSIGVVIAFVREKIAPDIVALSAMGILLALDIISTKDFLSVFSNSAPITIAMMFIVSAALERTGCIQIMGRYISRLAGKSYLRAMLVTMLTVMVASAFMNNIPVVIVMTPLIISLARSIDVAPSKMLIPLSFAAIFGGTTTLVGTSTNILISGVATQSGLAPLGMFEMTLPGLIFAGVGMLYMLFIGRFLLPNRYSLSSILDGQPKRQFLAEFLIPQDSTYLGKNISSIKEITEETEVIDVIRSSISLRRSMDTLELYAGDRIIIATNLGEVLGLKENGDLEFVKTNGNLQPVSAEEKMIVEGSISAQSSLVGRSVGALNFRSKYGVYILAVHRNDEDIRKNLDSVILRFGDTILIEGTAKNITRLLDDGHMINLTAPEEKPVRKSKAPIAFATMMGVVILSAFNVMPIASLAFIGAVVVMITGCVDPEDAYESIDWRILFLIFGMLGLSAGMEKTGAAALIVESLVSVIDQLGPVAILCIIYIITSILTEMVSNNAVAVLLGPIVIGIANHAGYDPKPFLMAVMFAASASFATPIGYQTNTFVYGAGGYKFNDFLKIGVPLNLIFAALATFIIPKFFPF